MPLAGEDRVAYVRTWIWSGSKQAAQVQVGSSDDGIKVWLNGRVLHAFNSARSNNPGEDKIAITLNEGWNSLLAEDQQRRRAAGGRTRASGTPTAGRIEGAEVFGGAAAAAIAGAATGGSLGITSYPARQFPRQILLRLDFAARRRNGSRTAGRSAPTSMRPGG